MQDETGFLDCPDGERLAWRQVVGRSPTVVWLGGFRSDMSGTKAQALARWAAARGQGFLRFDYFGHGASSGDFERGTISRWRQDALAVIAARTAGDLILVGSSMGGWLSCLVAMALPARVRAMALIAPAADFTSSLIVPQMDDAARLEMDQTGVWLRPSDYGDPYPITAALLEDGKAWAILPGPVALDIPVRCFQGGIDPDVPWQHALKLCQAIRSQDIIFTLIKDGDHRLSREVDIARLLTALDELVTA